jgi:hypothetical protein
MTRTLHGCFIPTALVRVPSAAGAALIYQTDSPDQHSTPRCRVERRSVHGRRHTVLGHVLHFDGLIAGHGKSNRMDLW